MPNVLTCACAAAMQGTSDINVTCNDNSWHDFTLTSSVGLRNKDATNLKSMEELRIWLAKEPYLHLILDGHKEQPFRPAETDFFAAFRAKDPCLAGYANA